MSTADTVSAINDKPSKYLGREILTDKELAGQLGISLPLVRSWKAGKRKVLTNRQIANLIIATKKNAEKEALRRAITTVVEFYQINASVSRGGKHWEIFSVRSSEGNTIPYLQGLRNELEKHNGVYVFYDSSGRAIYVGKAVLRSLWHEINSAFNRARGDVQSIYRVRHPQYNFPFRNSEEKFRQIKKQAVPIYELAGYLSAYAIPKDLISKFEALLVRVFANDLLNVRMKRLEPRVKRATAARRIRIKIKRVQRG